MFQQLRVFWIKNSNIAVFKKARKEIVYLPSYIENVTNAVTEKKNYLNKASITRRKPGECASKFVNVRFQTNNDLADFKR